MSFHFKNLVFEGGGVKAVAYPGALKALFDAGIYDHIERVAGVSAGAIVAALVAVGYTPVQIEKIMLAAPFNAFLDESFGVIRDVRRFMYKFGWFEGENLQNWIQSLIEAKTGIHDPSFGRLSKMGYRNLYVLTTDLSTRTQRIHSHETTPLHCVAKTVANSCRIPFVFAAQQSIYGHCIVDGGLVNNYPVKIFDQRRYAESRERRATKYYRHANKSILTRKKQHVYNKSTLGFRLDSGTQIAAMMMGNVKPCRKIDSIVDFTVAVIGAMMDAQDNRHLHSDDWQRTVYINTGGVSAMDFNIPDTRKTALCETGYKSTAKYLSWYKRSHPVNKIRTTKNLP